MIINAWIAIPLATAQDIREEYPDLPDKAQEALREMKEGFWRNITVGAKTYKIFDIVVPKIYVVKLTDKWPDIVILGAWDRKGNILKPIHPRIMDILEDDITYDANGNVISSVRPTQFKQSHMWLGWADRAIA